eukprot:552649-Pleurochrysis_carterae.AAC.1
MSAHLKTYGLGLDLRTKEERRRSQKKFYDDGEWQLIAPPRLRDLLGRDVLRADSAGGANAVVAAARRAAPRADAPLRNNAQRPSASARHTSQTRRQAPELRLCRLLRLSQSRLLELLLILRACRGRKR